MAVAVQLSPKNGAWLKALPGLSAEALAFFGSAEVESLQFWPEKSLIEAALLFHVLPEDDSHFVALRRALKNEAGRSRLRVRYGAGMLTAAEYLALHFEDLCQGLEQELELEGAGLEALEYELEGEARLVLRAAGSLQAERLRTKKAAQHLSTWLKRDCGDEVAVEIKAVEITVPTPPPPKPSKAWAEESGAAGRLEAQAAPAPSADKASIQAAPAAPPKPKGPSLLFGRPIAEGKVISLADLKPGDRGVIEGRVFGENDERVIGRERKFKKLKFMLSDGTDSVLCVVMMPPEEKTPKPLAKKSSGAWVRLQGSAEIDEYERNELVFKAASAMLLPPRGARPDLAAVKRVELHAHTKMSAADSVVDIAAFVGRAIEWGHEAVAVTDHGVVHAFPEAFKASDKGRKIKVLLGCEAYMVEDAEFLKNTGKLSRADQPFFNHVILLCRSEEGRKNLYRLISKSHLETYYKRPLIPKALLAQMRGGLLIGSACESGELMQAVLKGENDRKLEELASFYDYLEVQPPPNNAFMIREGLVKDEEQLREMVRKVKGLGEKLGKPVAATGDVHFLNPEDERIRCILQTGIGMSDAETQPPLYFKTTDEMIADLGFLGDDEARRLVIDAPRAIAALCDTVAPVPKGRFFPTLEGDSDNVRDNAYARAKQLYGRELPALLAERLEMELQAIISNGFASLYMIARLLVQESEKRGYSVGSRGSVGSSVVAYLLGVTEVNPMAAHERCEKCRFCEFRPMERLSGVDLPARPCPSCGGPLLRDGHNIPFATFVGIKGDKVPDIDLNFAPEVQNDIQRFVKTLFGEGKVFKAGTISTYNDRTAFGFVKKYYEAKGIVKRGAEIERVKGNLEGVKRTSGQHPGGVVLVKEGCDINDFTPVQYSGDSKERGGKEGSAADDLVITHFDFHSYDETLVKLDILGKDDASAFHQLELMTKVHEKQVPLDDPVALSLFHSRKALGFPKLSEEEEALYGPTGVVAIPEFGTENTRRMLELTRPKNFTELIYISGLSHGTNVWANNSEPLIREKKATLETVISTRDDIMNTLIQRGMEAGLAFNITEKVRKGKAALDGFSAEEDAALKATKLPAWWIESCKKIEYMFPKAHAAAYCFTAVRMAWFKAHHPRAFYAAWLSLHAGDIESDKLGSRETALKRIREIRLLEQEKKATPKDSGAASTLVVAYEAMLRGFSFDKVDLYRSHPFRVLPAENEKALLLPLVSLPGLGETAALNLDRERKEAPFTSIEDLAERAGLNKTVIEKLGAAGALDSLPKSNQITLF